MQPEKRRDERNTKASADLQVAATRAVFEGGALYPSATICATAAKESHEYTEKLLFDKLETIRRHNGGGLLVDLCCATGDHIPELRQRDQEALGLDFSFPFLQQAVNKRHEARFIASDARMLPLANDSVGLLYSLSALYLVPNLDRVIAEVSRVLRHGGRCILDLGNCNSLNSYCVRHHYQELPTSYHLPVSEMIRLCQDNKLRIIEHRAFQLLPLWAGRPRWLWLLLHPVWKKLLGARIAGRMIDEWLCSLPLLRRLAFRHLLVCEKC